MENWIQWLFKFLESPPCFRAFATPSLVWKLAKSKAHFSNSGKKAKKQASDLKSVLMRLLHTQHRLLCQRKPLFTHFLPPQELEDRPYNPHRRNRHGEDEGTLSQQLGTWSRASNLPKAPDPEVVLLKKARGEQIDLMFEIARRHEKHRKQSSGRFSVQSRTGNYTSTANFPYRSNLKVCV